MKTDVEQLTISLRDAQVRYGLSRTSLTKIGKENDALYSGSVVKTKI